LTAAPFRLQTPLSKRRNVPGAFAECGVRTKPLLAGPEDQWENTCGSGRSKLDSHQSMMTDLRAARTIRIRIAAISVDRRTDRIEAVVLGSDPSTSYLAAIKPFMDAVNSEGTGAVHNLSTREACSDEISHSSPRSSSMAGPIWGFVVPGYAGQIPRNSVVELPPCFAIIERRPWSTSGWSRCLGSLLPGSEISRQASQAVDDGNVCQRLHDSGVDPGNDR